MTHKQCTDNARCEEFLDALASVPIGGLTPLRRAVTNADFTDEDAPDTAPDAAAFRALLNALADAVEADLLDGIEVRDHDGGFVAMEKVEMALGALADPHTDYSGDPPAAAGEEAKHYGVWLDDTAADPTLTVWYDAPEDHESSTALPAATYTGRATYSYTGPAAGYARRGGYSGAFTAQTRLTLDLGLGSDAADQRIDAFLDRFAFRRSGFDGDRPPALTDWNGVRLELGKDTYSVSRGGAKTKMLNTASTWHTILYHEDREDREKPVAPAGLTGYFDLRFTGPDEDDRAVGAFSATR